MFIQDISAKTALKLTSRQKHTKGNSEIEVINRPLIAFLVVSVPAIIFLYLGRPGLPEKYSFDSNKIQGVASGFLYFDDRAFQTVGEAYRFLGLNDLFFLAGFAGCVAYGATASLVTALSGAPKFTPTSIFYLACMAICNAVYLAQYTKEFFQLPLIFVLIFLLSKTKKSIILITVAICIYAMTFRFYWVVTAANFLILATASSVTRSNWLPKMLVLALGLLVATPIVAQVFGYDVTDLRFGLNELRIGEKFANTAIYPPLSSSDPLSVALNQVILAGQLMVPIPLLFNGDLSYVPIALGISLIWIFVIKKQVDLSRTNPSTQNLVFLVLIAFLLTNSLFEPDFGSLLRHVCVLFPLMLMLIMQVSQPPGQAQQAIAPNWVLNKKVPRKS